MRCGRFFSCSTTSISEPLLLFDVIFSGVSLRLGGTLMNDRKSSTQRLLFHGDGPRWDTLHKQTQPQILEVLSQLLLDALQHCGDASISTEITTEEDHES
jgi:hypothetical protein